MKSSGDQGQQFNTTLVIAGVIALILAGTLVLFIYGCMKNSPNPPVKQTGRNQVITTLVDAKPSPLGTFQMNGEVPWIPTTV